MDKIKLSSGGLSWDVAGVLMCNRCACSRCVGVQQVCACSRSVGVQQVCHPGKYAAAVLVQLAAVVRRICPGPGFLR